MSGAQSHGGMSFHDVTVFQATLFEYLNSTEFYKQIIFTVVIVCSYKLYVVIVDICML